MNNFIKRSLLILFFAAVVLFSQNLYAQQSFGIGALLGGGTIKGNLPSQGSFSGSLFLDFDVPFIKGLSSRVSFIYVTDVNILLPKNPNRYTPFLRGLSLKEIYTSNMSGNVFFEGGIGPLVLNDRTFNNLNTWDAGVAFSILGGLDFTDGTKNGIMAGVGAEYGLTFTNTSVQYLSLYFQFKYQF